MSDIRWSRRSLMTLAMTAPLAGGLLRNAGAAEPIKIGFSMGLTGAYAGNGKAALLATQMWAEDQNAKGGLLGRPIQLIFYDDQSTPSLVPGIYTKLFDIDKVDLVISGYGTNIIGPAMPLVMGRNMVFMSLAGIEVNKTFNYPNYFQIFPFGPNASLTFAQGFFEVAAGMDPKPRTVAISVADSEFTQTAGLGARHWAKKFGLKTVYDQSFPPSQVDFSPILRAIQATKPDIVYISCFPPNSVGIVRGVREIGFKPMLIGGGMVGPQYASVKQQLGPLLNGFVNFETFVPEPTTEFPGVRDFLARYKPKAIAAGVDALGYYLPPFSYAGMQILTNAITATGGLDQRKIGDYIRKNVHKTIAGEVRFGPDGEWLNSRVMQVQYQSISGNDLPQFEKAGTQVILYPPAYKSGTLQFPLPQP
ncbi:amino acid ABC transporter substrate-binding protein [Pseudorhodoplanes sp.]|uniref:amino acid ABC transporter substrate-binding protein n=1 Tax=Pseudorhodoplanes sp. TaxID=1934341 RepID=UPI003D0BBA57